MWKSALKKLKELRAKPLPISASYLWALLFVALIGIWAATGEIKGGAGLKTQGHDETKNARADKPANQETPFKVRYGVFHNERRAAKLIIRGRTHSDLQVELKAETAGLIEALKVEKGDFVKKGEEICIIEAGPREAAMIEAKAALAQAEADLKASTRLVKRKYSSELKLMQDRAKRDAAMAALNRVEIDYKRTKIIAPFDGYVEDLPSKVGSFLNIGGHCATLVSLDPLLVVGAVRENDVANVKIGMKASATLVTGQKVNGDIIFVAANSDENTRTFRIELEFENPKGELKSGVTADIRIPLAPQNAMRIPPRILTLNDKGEVGVRLVGAGNIVRFAPVNILSEEVSGIWIDALPESSQIITVGQDFVKAGQKVVPVPDPDFAGKPGS